MGHHFTVDNKALREPVADVIGRALQQRLNQDLRPDPNVWGEFRGKGRPDPKAPAGAKVRLDPKAPGKKQDLTPRPLLTRSSRMQLRTLAAFWKRPSISLLHREPLGRPTHRR